MASPLDPVIHQQARLLIMAALYRSRRASFTDLRDGLELTSGNLASHATRLEKEGYIVGGRTLRSTGFVAEYTITDAGHRAFEAYLEALKGLLPSAGEAGNLASRT